MSSTTPSATRTPASLDRLQVEKGLMSSTTPSATRTPASLDRLQVEKGRLWTCGRDRAIFMISLRLGKVNVGGRPPAYFGARESNPSSLKLWITALTWSSEVKAIVAIWGTSIP